jgi:hypothetical protein
VGWDLESALQALLYGFVQIVGEFDAVEYVFELGF